MGFISSMYYTPLNCCLNCQIQQRETIARIITMYLCLLLIFKRQRCCSAKSNLSFKVQQKNKSEQMQFILFAIVSL